MSLRANQGQGQKQGQNDALVLPEGWRRSIDPAECESLRLEVMAGDQKGSVCVVTTLDGASVPLGAKTKSLLGAYDPYGDCVVFPRRYFVGTAEECLAEGSAVMGPIVNREGDDLAGGRFARPVLRALLEQRGWTAIPGEAGTFESDPGKPLSSRLRSAGRAQVGNELVQIGEEWSRQTDGGIYGLRLDEVKGGIGFRCHLALTDGGQGQQQVPTRDNEDSMMVITAVNDEWPLGYEPGFFGTGQACTAEGDAVIGIVRSLRAEKPGITDEEMAEALLPKLLDRGWKKVAYEEFAARNEAREHRLPEPSSALRMASAVIKGDKASVVRELVSAAPAEAIGNLTQMVAHLGAQGEAGKGALEALVAELAADWPGGRKLVAQLAGEQAIRLEAVAPQEIQMPIRTVEEPLGPTASWVVKEKATGRILFETFNVELKNRINLEKYEATPILEHLQGLNRK